MKQNRIGILLLALSIALMNLTLVGCTRRRQEDGNLSSTTTADSGSPLLPSPGSTTDTERPGTETTESESMSETATEQSTATTTEKETTASRTEETTKTPETTTGKTETTTKKPETTTKKPETTTTKQETTTKTPETTTGKTETTTKKPETTTKIPETTTTKQETTTKAPETTTTKQETTTKIPETTVIPQTTVVPETTTKAEGSAQTTLPEIGAGEWVHFEKFKDDHAGAAAYLGRSAQELPVEEIISRLALPLTPQDITVIDNGDSEDADGDEWYLILPRYRDTVVRLHDAETENGTSTAGELLAEGMHPMLVRCDPEDGDPSVYVELIRGEERITFALHADRELGKPMFHDSILNITPEQSAGMRRR